MTNTFTIHPSIAADIYVKQFIFAWDNDRICKDYNLTEEQLEFCLAVGKGEYDKRILEMEITNGKL